jgi:hypothetical protein
MPVDAVVFVVLGLLENWPLVDALVAPLAISNLR